MDWSILLGPVVVAALLTPFLTTLQQQRTANRQRREKVSDYHSALMAEIAVNGRRNFLVDLDQHRDEILRRMREDEKFIPMVPKHPSSGVYAQIVKEIHLIEGAAVELVVDYYFRESQIEALVEDLRSASFRKLEVERRCAAYSNYIELIKNALEAGRRARFKLRASHPGRHADVARRLQARCLRARLLKILAKGEARLPPKFVQSLQGRIRRQFTRTSTRRF